MQRTNYDSDSIDVSEAVRERHRRIAADVCTRENYGLLVGGEWVDSDGGAGVDAVDATTGETLATVQRGTATDVDRAVDAAREAFEAGTWGKTTASQRADMLDEIATRLESEKTRIARLDSLEMGKPNKHSLLVDNTILVDQFRTFASFARTADEGHLPPSGDDKHAYVRQEPYGVVGCIAAWNFPAMFVAWKLGPALAAGNSVVYKPSSRAVLSTLEIAEIADSVLPPGALNVVTGPGSEVGNAITSHEDVRKVSLTGSQAAGTHAMQNAAEHVAPVSLELGGKSPNIVFPDADIETAVEGTFVGVFFNSGQQCTAGSRLFLHADVYDEFVETFRERAQRLGVGDPLAPTTDIGPMVDHAHARDVQSAIDSAVEAGASVIWEGGDGGEELAGASFVRPTVLGDVDNEDAIAREEVFGPVLSVIEWEDHDTVVEMANDTEYGLAAGVWTNDLATAHDVAADLEAGTVWVNSYNDLFDPLPHGGCKASGIGRELSREALREYRQPKSVKVSLGDIPKL